MTACIPALVGFGYAHAQTVLQNDQDREPSDQSGFTISVMPPPGFEDLISPLETEYDVFFQGDLVGTTGGRLSGGQFSFLDPDAILDLIGPGIVRERVREFVSSPLNANENLACVGGNVIGCGTLLRGQSGVVVSADRFRVDLFLDRSYLEDSAQTIEFLPAPVSGPSLIQNLSLAASIGEGVDGISSEDAYSAIFDTFASVGRTSVVARTFIDNESDFRIEEARAQHIRDNWRASAGLLQSFSSPVVQTYQAYGGEVTNRTGTRLDRTAVDAIPLDVVLPERAVVQIFRDDVLISAREYPAGLQRLITSELPIGSYPIRILAVSAGRTLIDETRSYSKTTGLPPENKWLYEARLGVRADNGFQFNRVEDNGSLLPTAFDDVVGEFRLSRRLTNSMAATAAITYIDNRVYPELGLDWFPGLATISLAGAFQSEDARAAIASVAMPIGPFDISVSARHTRSDIEDRAIGAGVSFVENSFDAFLRDEDQIFGSVQTRLFGGFTSVTGAYTVRPGDLSDTYRYGFRYGRNIGRWRNVNARLELNGSVSDFDDRAGFTLRFSRRLNINSSIQGGVGVDYQKFGDDDEVRPLADLSYVRSIRGRDIDADVRLGARTDVQDDRISAGALVASEYGTADFDVALVDRRNSGAGTLTSAFVNAQTGFALAQGGAKIGLRRPGESMVIMKVRPPELTDIDTLSTDQPVVANSSSDRPLPEATSVQSQDRRVAKGGYRMVVDEGEYGFIDGNGTTAIGLPALNLYRVGLRPDGAPPYDLDLTTREIPLFPGNVAVISWEAIEVQTIFGQLIDTDGTPLALARIETEGDATVTDDNGYFTLSSSPDEAPLVRTRDGRECQLPKLSRLTNSGSEQLFYRVGSLNPCN